MPGHGLGEPRAHAVELPGRKRVARNLPRGVAALDAVLPGRGQADAGNEAVDVRDRAAADQRHRAAGRPMQLLDELPQLVIEEDAARRVGELDEGSVDVEEIGPVPPGRPHLSGAPWRTRLRGT